MKSVIALVAALATLTSAATTSAVGAKPTFGTWGFDLAGMDKSVKPGDDFFSYANGAWYAKAVIPADRTSTGSFADLAVLSEHRMLDIVAGLEAKPYGELSAEEKKLRDLYDAFVDTTAIEKTGLTSARKDLDAIAALQTTDEVARAMGSVALGADSLFAARIGADSKDSNTYAMTVSQSGLGLPDRDYYLRADPNLQTTRDAYRKYLATILDLAGTPQATERADAVYALEVAIAKASWPAADRRDADKTYNPMTVFQLNAFAPGFPWTSFFAARDLPVKTPTGDRLVVVRETTAIEALAKLFAAAPVPVWRDWLTCRYLHTHAAYLPARFDDADFAFFGRVLGGQQAQLPRNIRGVHLLDQRLGHPLGKIYVAKYFPAESKAKVETLVANLLKAYDADIRQIPWMTDTTRQRALEKLHAFTPHVGSPDVWRSVADLTIKKDDLLGDISRSDVFEWHYRVARIDQRVDRNEWTMTPPTINAYYTSTFNAIFFPAAILQPPFFDPAADDAVNYGGIGAVIGHEISHGFDDQGSKYNGAGLLQSWWTDADRAAFDARTKMLGAQYDSYEGLPGLHVNGQLTMGENIGDLSGLTIALKAYHVALGGKPAPVLDGYTGDQRFFLAFAQIWREKARESYMRERLLSNPHSPSHFRVIGPTRDLDAWYTAFHVKPGDAEYLPPDRRVRLW